MNPEIRSDVSKFAKRAAVSTVFGVAGALLSPDQTTQRPINTRGGTESSHVLATNQLPPSIEAMRDMVGFSVPVVDAQAAKPTVPPQKICTADMLSIAVRYIDTGLAQGVIDPRDTAVGPITNSGNHQLTLRQLSTQKESTVTYGNWLDHSKAHIIHEGPCDTNNGQGISAEYQINNGKPVKEVFINGKTKVHFTGQQVSLDVAEIAFRRGIKFDTVANVVNRVAQAESNIKTGLSTGLENATANREAVRQWIEENGGNVVEPAPSKPTIETPTPSSPTTVSGQQENWAPWLLNHAVDIIWRPIVGGIGGILVNQLLIRRFYALSNRWPSRVGAGLGLASKLIWGPIKFFS